MLQLSNQSDRGDGVHVFVSEGADYDLLAELREAGCQILTITQATEELGIRIPAELLAHGYDTVVIEGLGADGEDLPAGVFPEAATESREAYLSGRGYHLNRLNGEAYYESDLDKTWHPLSPESVHRERLGDYPTYVPTPEELAENQRRQTRWLHVERYLRDVYLWASCGRGPEIVPYRNSKGESSWRFRINPKWDEDGIAFPPDANFKTWPQPQPVCFGNTAAVGIQVDSAGVLLAAWNYLFWCRRRWLQAHPGQVWLAEDKLHLIRVAFREMFHACDVPVARQPVMKEDPKPSYLDRLEAELASLRERERQALARLQGLSARGELGPHNLPIILNFLDQLAADLEQAQDRLEHQTLSLAMLSGFYDVNFLGGRLDQFALTPEELLDLREEVRCLEEAALI